MDKRRKGAGAVLAAGSLFLAGCASSTYWSNRGRDAKDVLTCAVGLGLGAKARVGPLQVPLIVQSDYTGLRCGEFFASPMREDFWTYVSEAGHVVDQPLPVYVRDYDTLYSGYEIFDPGGLSTVRHKRVNSQGMGIFATFDDDHRNYGFYSQVECVVGVVFSVRLGVNPGELVDCLVGFTGLDIFCDDT
ncbi:MAG: hypothetical protein WCK89_08680 [bacterium]